MSDKKGENPLHQNSLVKRWISARCPILVSKLTAVALKSAMSQKIIVGPSSDFSLSLSQDDWLRDAQRANFKKPCITICWIDIWRTRLYQSIMIFLLSDREIRQVPLI
jgi:hypothetical protein